MRYPTREGMPVPVHEIELPRTHYETTGDRNVNNHHLNYCRKKFGQFVISQIIRDLDAYQHVMYKDQHQALHDRFDQSLHLPTPYQMMDRVDQAYQTDELLRLGPALSPVYTEITPEQYQAALDDFERMIR